ncbi:MAG: acetate--CoA ligase family protein [Pseudomonadota bacterium]
MDGTARLLRPKSVAVVGGGQWCANVVEACRSVGFAGPIWPVHPTRESVGGLPAFRDIADLPAVPDAAFIGVNRDATIEAVRALSVRGAGGAVCFASGFAESGDADGVGRQRALVEAAGDVTLLGPNCYGFLNYLDGVALWPDQHGGRQVSRGVAIIAQSSNIALNITMQRRGLPVAFVATVGNQAQTGLSHLARALLADERVTALGLYIEGIDDLAAFEAMAVEAHALGKPIIAIKSGRSDASRAASVSHTAAIVGSDRGADALFARLGIGRTASLPAFLEALKLVHVTGRLPSARVASMSCSGGEAGLVADTVHGHKLALPPLTLSQTDALRAVLGPAVALSNPLDYHTAIWGDADKMAATFAAMMAGGVALGIVVLDLPRDDRCDPAAWEPVIAAVVRARAISGRPMAIAATLPELMPEAVALDLLDQGIVPLIGLDEAVAAIAIAATEAPRTRPPILIPPPAQLGRVLHEADAKTALADYGLSVPIRERAECPERAAAAASRIGFPVALKGEGFAHKSDAGAVALNLADADSVITAAHAMPAETFLVEAMVTGAATELLIGVVADPAHGYVLTLAAGGTLSEVLGDSTSLLLPVEADDVRDALEGLRIAPLLTGFRGRPAADVDAIVAAALALQSFVVAEGPQEIEVNPLLCGPHGAVAVDALIRA